MRWIFLFVLSVTFQMKASSESSSLETAYLTSTDPSDTLSALLSVPEDEIDLTLSKLVLDRLIDPSVDIDATRREIEALAVRATQMIGANVSSSRKVEAIRTLIYEPGVWNEGAEYSYDFGDPNGLRASSKTLDHYLQTKRGNCINMPFLFLAVGEQLGVEMNATSAPRHVFLQFDNPETGKVEHLETTSGAHPQTLTWQRQVLPMTDRAIETGMYMQRLDKRQQVALMAEILLHDLNDKNENLERLEVAQLILSVFPQSDVALMHTIDGYRLRVGREFEMLYPTIASIPASERARFDRFVSAHADAQRQLIDLGWQRAVANENVVMPGDGKPANLQ